MKSREPGIRVAFPLCNSAGHIEERRSDAEAEAIGRAIPGRKERKGKMMHRADSDARARKHAWRILLALCLMLALPGKGASGSANPDALSVHVYSARTLQDLVAKHGIICSDAWGFTVRRNSQGTALHIWTRPHGFFDMPPVLVVSSRDDVQKVSPPAGMNGIFAMNDKGEPVVCTEAFKRGLVFANGTHYDWDDVKLGFYPDFGVDPGGRYFFISAPNITEVVDVDRPAEVLVRSRHGAKSIYFTDDVLYLLVRPRKDDAKEKKCAFEVESYKKTGSGFELNDVQTIPEPSSWCATVSVEDFDPISGRVLLLTDYGDMPLNCLNARYLYDLKSMKMTRIGFSQGHGLFLQRDILEAAGK